MAEFAANGSERIHPEQSFRYLRRIRTPNEFLPNNEHSELDEETPSIGKSQMHSRQNEGCLESHPEESSEHSNPTRTIRQSPPRANTRLSGGGPSAALDQKHSNREEVKEIGP